jgi:hypothetical protein
MQGQKLNVLITNVGFIAFYSYSSEAIVQLLGIKVLPSFVIDGPKLLDGWYVFITLIVLQLISIHQSFPALILG